MMSTDKDDSERKSKRGTELSILAIPYLAAITMPTFGIFVGALITILVLLFLVILLQI